MKFDEYIISTFLPRSAEETEKTAASAAPAQSFGLQSLLMRPEVQYALLGAGVGGVGTLVRSLVGNKDDAETTARKTLTNVLLGGLAGGGLSVGLQGMGLGKQPLFGRGGVITPDAPKVKPGLSSYLAVGGVGAGVAAGAGVLANRRRRVKALRNIAKSVYEGIYTDLGQDIASRAVVNAQNYMLSHKPKLWDLRTKSMRERSFKDSFIQQMLNKPELSTTKRLSLEERYGLLDKRLKTDPNATIQDMPETSASPFSKDDLNRAIEAQIKSYEQVRALPPMGVKWKALLGGSGSAAGYAGYSALQDRGE